MTLLALLNLYVMMINLLCAVMFGLDKWRAKHALWRISELDLMTAAFLGGSIGGLFAMYVLRHKIRKPKFYIGLPMCGIFNAVIYFVVYHYLTKGTLF